MDTPVKELKIIPKPSPILRGPRGLRGPEGKKGDQGERGEQGLVGPQGEQGLQGIRGPQGEQGLRGKDGDSIVGPRGPRGPEGKAGNDGVRGLPGQRGEQGRPGRDGKKGKDFKVRDMSRKDIAFLKDNIVGKVVTDVVLKDDVSSFEVKVKYSDDSQFTKKIMKGGGTLVVPSVVNEVTNITEEILDTEDKENLASTAKSLEELVKAQREQLNRVETQLKYIKTHMAVVTGERITDKDIEK